MSDTTFVPRERVVVINAEGTPWRPGQEVSIEEVERGWVSVIGYPEHFWLAERFRKVVPTIDVSGATVTFPDANFASEDDYAIAMTTPTRVIVVANDIDLNKVPRRPYDHLEGDRRFTSPDAAVEYAHAERDRTGIIQVVRRDPGSYDFQELFLVQALGS